MDVCEKNKNKCYSFISDYVIFSNRQMRVKICFSATYDSY